MKEGEATGMQKHYGSSLMQRHDEDLANVTLGYNFSRAPGVTSINTDYNNLGQIYYQRGTSTFVGGTSTSDGNGIFVQEFNGQDSASYSGRVAQGLRFKKSYFYFGDDIVLLASGISNNSSNNDVETGLLQEAVSAGENEFSFANNVTTNASNYDAIYSSTDVPWMFNNSQNVGLYLMPNQNYKLFKGSQTFGSLTGDVVSTYLTHDSQTEGWYEYIMRLNTSKTEMQTLDSNMKSSTPDYEVLRRDEKAHIVRSENHNSTGYAIFDNTDLVLPEGSLKTADKQCVVMLQEKDGDMNLSISYPDKK
ncbi:chondroitinase [Algibacter lectus]|uniref:Chondroitinase n=1 Tax=Algibacter lectus TaxID=221126 RepID=A0A090X1V6_9FLAO|nr:chondroitinase [Algibacter lectus]